MRRIGGLFDRLVTVEHLARAADRTLRGKSRRPDAAWFAFNRETRLIELRRRLVEGTWRPGGFHVRRIHDPKPRAIACAPFIDRVLHTAPVLLAEPTFLRGAIHSSYACRPGGGSLRAVLHLQRGLRRHRHVVHLDVRAFFPSIHVPTLKGLLARKVRDRRYLEVFARVLDDGTRVYRDPSICRHARLTSPWPVDRGLPIGALTSQLCAGFVYLNGLDHFVKRTLKVPTYVRYMDDFFCFGDRRADLLAWRAAIAEWLDRERSLTLKHPRAPILSGHGHLDALGYRIRRHSLEALPKAYRRLRQRTLAVTLGEVDLDTYAHSMQSTTASMLF